MTTRDLLWLFAIILLIGWVLGYFVFAVGALIHLLLVVIVVLVIIRLVLGRPVD